jgi:hypothetical protein
MGGLSAKGKEEAAAKQVAAEVIGEAAVISLSKASRLCGTCNQPTVFKCLT